YACQGQLYLRGMSPYAHGVADLPCTWLAHAPALWVHTTSPYGPAWIALTAGAAATGTYAGAVLVLRVIALAGIALAVGYGYRLAGVLRPDPSPGAWVRGGCPP